MGDLQKLPLKDRPCIVSVDIPSGWHVEDGNINNTFEADVYMIDPLWVNQHCVFCTEYFWEEPGQPWTLLAWGNHLATSGGTLQGEFHYLPFKKLSKNLSR